MPLLVWRPPVSPRRHLVLGVTKGSWSSQGRLNRTPAVRLCCATRGSRSCALAYCKVEPHIAYTVTPGLLLRPSAPEKECQ